MMNTDELNMALRACVEDMKEVASEGKMGLDAQVRAYDLLSSLLEALDYGRIDVLPAHVCEFRETFASVSDRLDAAFDLDADASNNEVLSLINKAKAIDESNINHYKAEILGNLRLRKFGIAQQLLQNYIVALNEMENHLKDIESDNTWEVNYKFIVSERDWANRMIVKVKVM